MHVIIIAVIIGLSGLGCAKEPINVNDLVAAYDVTRPASSAKTRSLPPKPIYVERIKRPVNFFNEPPPLHPVDIKAKKKPKRTTKPATVIERSNKAARAQPEEASYVNGEHQYTFESGVLYSIYAAPGRVTTLILETGEEIRATGVFIGDSNNWQIHFQGTVGFGPEERVVVAIMPLKPSVKTNLTLASNRRMYLIELKSYRETYMPAVSWTYPQQKHKMWIADQKRREANEKLMREPEINPSTVKTPYRIETVEGTPTWTPSEAMHDSRRTYITFGKNVEFTPALFASTDEGLEVVNMRVRDNDDGGFTYVIDQVLREAELRLSHGEDDGEPGARVLITRRPKAWETN